MKNLWLGFLGGIAAAFGLALVAPEHDVTRQEDRASEPVGAANCAAVSQPIESFESAVGALRAQFDALWRSEPWARGEIDELLSAWRVWLASSNPARVARALSPYELATPFGTAALEAWLALDSAAAGAWIADQPGATDHHAWLVAEALTQQPELLSAFCERLEHNSWAQAFLDYSSRGSLRSNPPAALSLAETLTPGERQTRVFETIACDWVLRDPGAARAWINGVDDPVVRQRLVVVGAQSYASADPLSALEWLLAQTPADAVVQEPLQTIARLWRQTADPETVAWLNDWFAGSDGRIGSDPRTR